VHKVINEHTTKRQRELQSFQGFVVTVNAKPHEHCPGVRVEKSIATTRRRRKRIGRDDSEMFGLLISSRLCEGDAMRQRGSGKQSASRLRWMAFDSECTNHVSDVGFVCALCNPALVRFSVRYKSVQFAFYDSAIPHRFSPLSERAVIHPAGRAP
jgi:hypothetical protein